MKEKNFESNQKFLDKEGIAARYSVSQRTIDQWRQDHQMPCRKIGLVIRFSIAETDLWYENFRVGQTDGRKDGE